MILYIIHDPNVSPYRLLNLHRDKWSFYYLGCAPHGFYDERGIHKISGKVSDMKTILPPNAIITKDGKWHQIKKGRGSLPYEHLIDEHCNILSLEYEEVK